MAVEIASAYVSLSADTRQIPKEVRKALGQAEGAAASSGQSIGQKISSGLGKTLKTGALAGGAAAGAALGMSLKKGFDRLSAIEQSEAKLSGLGHSTESVAKIMDNALGSVKGTAYGLGDAASVAAGMVASGIKPGKELEGVLKTMGDTAAIAGRDLTDMGLIFQSVAAKGKLQGDDMMQLMSSGIPVLQLLGDELGKTSEEVSEMVSNGEIDFETFEKAMKKGMGGAALEAGKTFKGSMDNMGAAMGRFGETLLKGAFSKAPDVIGSVTDGIDALNDKVGGAIELFSTGEFSEDIGEKLGVGKDSAVVDRILSARDAVEKMRGAVELFFTGDFNSSIRERLGVEEDSKLVDDILRLRDVFADWGERVGNVFRELGELGGKLAPSFGSIAASLGKATAKVSAATWEALLRIVEALVPVLEKVLVPAFEGLAKAMEDHPRLVEAIVAAFVGFKVLKGVDKMAFGLIGTFTKLGKSGTLLKGAFSGAFWAKQFPGLATTFSKIGASANTAKFGLSALPDVFRGAGAAAKSAGNPVSNLFKFFTGGTKIGSVVSKVGGAFTSLSGALSGMVAKGGLVRIIGLFGKFALRAVPIVGVIYTIYEALKWFFTKTETGQKVFEGLKNVLSNVWNWIRDTLVAGMEWARDVISGIWDGISTAANVAWEGMKLAWDTYGQPVLDFILGVFNFFWDGIKLGFRLLRATFEVAWTALKMAWDAFGQPMVDWIIGAFQRFWGGIKTVFGWIKIGWDTLWQGLKLAWDTIGAPIVNFVKGAFNILWTGLSTVFGWIKTGWNLLWQALQTAWNTIGQPVVDFIVRAFNIFKDGIGRAFDTVKGFAEGLWNSISEWFGKISDKVGGIKDNILDKFKGAKDWLVESGGNIIDGLLNGIGDLGKKIGDWFLDKIPGWIKEPFKKALGIKSPSRVFAGFGKNIGEGLINGIDGMGRKVEKSAQAMADRVAGVEMPEISASVDSSSLAVSASASMSMADPSGAMSIDPGVSGTASNPAPSSRYEGGAPPAARQVEQGTESFEASSEAVNASVQTTFDPAVQQADLSMTGFGANVQATATGVVTPQWQGMANNVAMAANGVIAPAFGAVQAGLSNTGARFVQQTTGVMTPMWNSMGANVARVRQAVTDPAMAGIRSALSATGAHFTNSVNGTINPIWSVMGNHVKAVKDGTVLPVFNAVEGGLTKLSGWFGTTVSNISTAWDRLRGATARPARFVIDTVMNNGIRNAWNAVAELIDEKPMRKVGHNLGGFARGGVLPGYTPGRDVHHFSSPTGGRVSLSGGEAIMRPEWTRAVGGAKAVAAMNAAARSGKFSKRAKEESKANGYHQAFAEGGIVQAMTRIVQRKYPMLTMTSGQAGRSGGLHGAGMAADFSNGSGNTPQQLALARDISKTYPNSAELIYDSPGWSGNIKNGQNVGAFGQFYTMAQAGPHHHHVHWGMNTAPTMPFGGGVFPGGSSGGAVAMVSMADMAKDAWDAEIKKIPKYNGKNGLIGAMPGSYQKSASEKAWGYLKKQADKMDADAGPGSWNPGAGVEQYRAGIKKAFRFQQEEPKKNRVDALLRQIWTESKGDPNIAQQIVDMNGTGESAGVGLYQVIPSTWAGFRDPRLPDNRRNVWAAHNFAVRYFRDRHNWNTGPGGVGLPNTGWKSGGVLPENLPAALFDDGGYLQDGQVGQNQSGKPEPVFTHKQWQILKGNIMSAAQAGDLKKLQANLGVVANGLQQAVAKLDWQEIFGAASKAFNDKFFEDQASDVRSVFGIPDPDSIPAVKAYAEFRENEKKLNEEQSQAAKDSREAATRADSAADKISGAPVPVKAKSESVSAGSQVARTGALVSRALANPNPVSVGAAAKSGGDTIQFIVRNEEAAWSEYRKFQAKNSRGRVGAR